MFIRDTCHHRKREGFIVNVWLGISFTMTIFLAGLKLAKDGSENHQNMHRLSTGSFSICWARPSQSQSDRLCRDTTCAPRT